MTYLTLIFASPIYFAMRQKWGAFCLNLVLYGTACLFLVTIIGAFIAPFFWMLAVGHASWHLRHELMLEEAEILATKMAEKVRLRDDRPAPGRGAAAAR